MKKLITIALLVTAVFCGSATVPEIAFAQQPSPTIFVDILDLPSQKDVSVGDKICIVKNPQYVQGYVGVDTEPLGGGPLVFSAKPQGMPPGVMVACYDATSTGQEKVSFLLIRSYENGETKRLDLTIEFTVK